MSVGQSEVMLAYQLVLISGDGGEDCLGEDPGLVLVLVDVGYYHWSGAIHHH